MINVLAFLPESILFLGALLLLMIDVFFGKKTVNMPRILFVAATIISVTALLAVVMNFNSFYSSFEGAFYSSRFTSFVKIIAIAILIFNIFLSADFVEEERRISSEFLVLMMIATVGGMLMISSNNLLAIYMALELQSFSLYLLAAIKRDSSKSSEAGVKYFLLGAAASGILLFGISLIYGFAGTIDINSLISYYQANYDHIPVAIYLGFVLVTIALLFKVSAAPFHMWTPDVYEGSTTIVTTLFASLVKFISIIILIRLYVSLTFIWPDMHQIIITVAILSLLVGALGAIRQNNIKRMLAYGAIGHIGFVLAGLAVADIKAIKAMILYAVIYSSLSLGAFAFLMMLQDDSNKPIDAKSDHIYDMKSIAGLAKTSPIIGMSLAVIMFSMTGIPPLAGFFSKFYILLSVVERGFYPLAVIAVLCSVVSAFYYLRIVKIIYFDGHNDNQKDVSLVINNGSIVLIIMALANLLFLAYLNPLIKLISDLL
ncbi:MAG: nuoN [Rickettsiaceae bacterium]|jgi:NADH-quinone oxidoreductase subunit N|nr:nuoN [Rickettsiaceae bacterium]